MDVACARGAVSRLRARYRRADLLTSLIWLTLGAFATGTEGFMIAGLLPALARGLNVGLPAAGHLVTAFSLAYAIGAPRQGRVDGRAGAASPAGCRDGRLRVGQPGCRASTARILARQPSCRVGLLCDPVSSAGKAPRSNRSRKPSAWSRHPLSPSRRQSVKPSMTSAGIVTSATTQPICVLLYACKG